MTSTPTIHRHRRTQCRHSPTSARPLPSSRPPQSTRCSPSSHLLLCPPPPPFPTHNAPTPSSSTPPPPKEWSLGIEYNFLITLRNKWLEEWKWGSVSQRLDKMDHFLVDYADPILEDTHESDERYELTIHFVHQRSTREDAIPLLIMHGWPGTSVSPLSFSSHLLLIAIGTFFDFNKIIEPLVNPPSPDLPAYVSPLFPRLHLALINSTHSKIPRCRSLPPRLLPLHPPAPNRIRPHSFRKDVQCAHGGLFGVPQVRRAGW